MRTSSSSSASNYTHAPGDDDRLYFHNTLAQVEWHSNGYIYVRWKDEATCSAEFRAVFRYVQALLSLTQSSLVLSDQRLLQPPAEADIVWLIHEWTPAVVRETSYSHRALLSSHSNVTCQQMASVTECDAATALITRHFSEVEAAAHWLRSVYV